MPKVPSKPKPKLEELIRTKPFSFQVQAFLRARRHKRYALFMEQGTGKTLVAIGLALYHRKRNRIGRVLVVTPDSVMGEWIRQFREHAADPSVRARMLTGRLDERRRWLSRHNSDGRFLDVLIANYVSLRELTDELVRWRPDMVILDESQKIKNRKTKQSKAAHRLGKVARYRYILTGTPVSESPLDLWSQYRFLDPKIFHESYYAFQNRYAIMGGFQRKQVRGYKRLEEFAARAHSIAYRVTKDEALDLPGTLDQIRTFELSAEERRHYRDMHKDFLLRFSQSYTVSAPLVLTQMMKLQQIASGFVLDEEGQVVSWPSSKLRLLKEILEDIPNHRKVVIFAKFIFEIQMIADLCRKLKIPVGVMRGETKNRQELIDQFQNTDRPRVMVIQTSVGGLGITLTRASYAIFFSMSHSFVDYDQARARVYRIGQTNKVTYIHLVARDTIEEDILKAVQEKGTVADLVTNILRKQVKVLDED